MSCNKVVSCRINDHWIIIQLQVYFSHRLHYAALHYLMNSFRPVTEKTPEREIYSNLASTFWEWRAVSAPVSASVALFPPFTPVMGDDRQRTIFSLSLSFSSRLSKPCIGRSLSDAYFLPHWWQLYIHSPPWRGWDRGPAVLVESSFDCICVPFCCFYNDNGRISLNQKGKNVWSVASVMSHFNHLYTILHRHDLQGWLWAEKNQYLTNLVTTD